MTGHARTLAGVAAKRSSAWQKATGPRPAPSPTSMERGRPPTPTPSESERGSSPDPTRDCPRCAAVERGPGDGSAVERALFEAGPRMIVAAGPHPRSPWRICRAAPSGGWTSVVAIAVTLASRRAAHACSRKRGRRDVAHGLLNHACPRTSKVRAQPDSADQAIVAPPGRLPDSARCECPFVLSLGDDRSQRVPVDVLEVVHGAELRAAHRAELGGLEVVVGERLVVHRLRGLGVQ